jgi:hypothetical protein
VGIIRPAKSARMGAVIRVQMSWRMKMACRRRLPMTTNRVVMEGTVAQASAAGSTVDTVGVTNLLRIPIISTLRRSSRGV